MLTRDLYTRGQTGLEGAEAAAAAAREEAQAQAQAAQEQAQEGGATADLEAQVAALGKEVEEARQRCEQGTVSLCSYHTPRPCPVQR
eukprot:2049890-Rhodomonas_salina.1